MTAMNNSKVLIAMSGGVDSSVAAFLLKNNGYECHGATMSLLSDNSGDIDDAKKIADSLGFSFSVFDFQKEFKNFVVEEFVKAYTLGKTPNPCIFCNKNLKFSEMLKKADELDCGYLATGHYARVELDENTGKYVLKKAKDASKDQSYVLYMLTQDILSRLILPLGDFSKPEIRKIAEENGLVTAHKSDSQDICFVPNGDYAAFIENYLGKQFPQGNFVLRDGTVLGKNKGIIHYTLGQRKGLGVSYTKPLFVCEINTETNNVVLGDNEDLFTDTLKAENVNIISGENFTEPVRCKAKIRYKHTESDCTAFVDSDGILNVKFDEPQRAVTKGQAVVLYDSDTVLGGGEII